MKQQFSRILYLPLLFLAAGFLYDASTRGVEAEAPIVVRGAARAVPDLNGQWTGRWTDTRFSVTDSVQFTITVTGSTVSGTGVLGMNNAFGLPDEAGTITGTIIGDEFSFSFTTDTATGSGSMIGPFVNGGTGNIGGLLNFGGYVFNGEASDTHMEFDFQFDDPSGGFGIVSLDKAGVSNASASLGEVKSRFGD